jgi:hypothetical protein
MRFDHGIDCADDAGCPAGAPMCDVDLGTCTCGASECDGNLRGDYRIGVDEFKADDDIRTVLLPELDLLAADGSFDPGADGEPDSVSLGFGFTCVGASF